MLALKISQNPRRVDLECARVYAKTRWRGPTGRCIDNSGRFSGGGGEL